MSKKYKTFKSVVDYLKNHSLIVKSTLKGNILWAIQSHSGGSFISAFEITGGNSDFKYRGYSEGSNPVWTACPKEYLDEVKKVTSKKWRSKVLAETTRTR